MEELKKIITWIDWYEDDNDGVLPNAKLIQSIMRSRVLEIKEKTKDFLCDRECSGENKCDNQCYTCSDMDC